MRRALELDDLRLEPAHSLLRAESRALSDWAARCLCDLLAVGLPLRRVTKVDQEVEDLLGGPRNCHPKVVLYHCATSSTCRFRSNTDGQGSNRSLNQPGRSITATSTCSTDRYVTPRFARPR